MRSWTGLQVHDLHVDSLPALPGVAAGIKDDGALAVSGEQFGQAFAELEADILLRLAPIAQEQLRLLYALDLALLAPTRGSTEPQPPIWRRMRGLYSDAACELQKAFEAICVLRRLARELTGELDQMNQYYWALLMETLISVLRNYSDVEASAKAAAINRARLSAALIAERLAAWNSDWPPRGWPRPEDLPERSEPPTVVEPDEE